MSNNSSIYINETSIVDDGAVIGKGTKIWHWVHISSGAIIGENCSFGQNVYIGKAKIGNNVKVQNNVSIYDNINIEDFVFCGPSIVFTNVYNPRAAVSRRNEFKTTIIKFGATLGANCTIVCGIEIGSYAFIGAGAVVNRDVKPYALMAGVPAKQIGWMSTFGERVKVPLSGNMEWECPNTGEIYKLEGENLRRLT